MAAHNAMARPWSSSLSRGGSDMLAIVGVLMEGQVVVGVAMSSCRWSRGGFRVPDGWRESASLVWFLTPGMYTIRKRYLRVFSLRFLRRGFGMSSKHRSPNNLRSGRWSTATMRSLQPRTKWRALSKESATARASPSTGEYLDSAGWVKREPTRVTRQPSRQQKISREGQWQCFWNNQYPIPSLLQSVTRQVGRSLSKMVTPSLMCSQITRLESANERASSSVQRNGVEGFRRVQKGSMVDVIEKAYATWLTRPNQARTSVMLVGVGKSVMDSRNLAQGLTSVRVMLNPANSTSSMAKRNLRGFRVMPFSAQISNHSAA